MEIVFGGSSSDSGAGGDNGSFSDEEAEERLSVFLCMLGVIICLPLLLGLTFTLWFQFNVVRSNTTSMEISTRRWRTFDAREVNQPFNWYFDYGTIGNFRALLGDSVWLWPLPIVAAGDGFSWRGLVYRNGTLMEETL
jgi:hypothetical protein